ncbi:putative mediator of RNA polymerase II transcription subunit 26 [Stomoxys calcitrans]|uniref:putative mediator of RNA polymerase II transcription subunit 26 n=1 Tax=Stomoxys calcitrans TaxID=35570 RepID=UPI0027E34364|nr:putative mediator of RNA polymerase II transcription subunit 26 [Stomoxys calcitrans]
MKLKYQSLVCGLLVLLLTDYGYASTKSANTKDATAAAATVSKAIDKLSYPKKVSTLKKRPPKSSLKKVADITDKFKDLPAEDLAFIKELDKQFRQHGGKVKIKVENDNATLNTKNSKRTIDGELGYGYSHNGYDYSPPKYSFYPYSQNDIPSNAPKYYLPKTEVSVEPSYSYELKPETYITHNGGHGGGIGAQADLPHPELNSPHQHHQQHQQVEPQQQQYEEPVIVLRIPGPAKYASHLQMLLQQYLEIRATQYLRILEEAEHRNHHQHLEQQQQHQQPELQQIEYGHAGSVEQVEQQQHQVQPESPAIEQHHYSQQQQYEPQPQYEQQPQYPDIDDVYQHYKHRHPSHPEQAQQPEQPEQSYYAPDHQVAEQPQQHYAVPEAPQQHQQQTPQFYYTHQQEYAQPEGPPANTYQHVFLISMAVPAHTGYEATHAQTPQQDNQDTYVHEPSATGGVEEHNSLPISENNPRASHTKVIFSQNAEHAGADYSNGYPLPSIKPNERRPPHSIPNYHQDYQEQIYSHQAVQQEPQESAKYYQQHEAAAPGKHQQVMAATQKPFNYHAHAIKSRARGRISHKRRATDTTVPNNDEGLQKINDYVRDKLGAQTGTTSEFKTTRVINP